MPARRAWSSVLKDPPPDYLFELSETGVAMARTGDPPQFGFQPLEPDVLSISPLRDNVLRLEELTERVRALAPAAESRKRQRAVLMLPDGSVRVTVLDFDAFPADAGQQLSLVRFRLRKSLPFDLDACALSYCPQAAGGGRVDVVAAVAPLEVVARYEAAFRAAGFHPGLVTTSTLAALNLVRGKAPAALLKLSGQVLTLSLMEKGVLKLLRSIELSEGTAEEILGHLYPTFAYAEDHLAARPQRLLSCGLNGLEAGLRPIVEAEWGLPVEPLRSRYGAAAAHNAGLLGCLEAVEES